MDVEVLAKAARRAQTTNRVDKLLVQRENRHRFSYLPVKLDTDTQQSEIEEGS
jgi:hypothetical protein